MFSALQDLDALDEAQEDAAEQYADASDPRNQPEFLSSCTSHAILVMDTSASMRTLDAISASGGNAISRIDALLHAFQDGFVAQQQSAGLCDSDFLSFVRLADDAELIVEMEPMTSGLPRVPSTVFPMNTGNYIPALQCVETLVNRLEKIRSTHPNPATAEMCTHVLFMSDGAPSDSVKTQLSGGKSKRDAELVTRVVCDLVGSIWRRLGCDEKRLKFFTVGFGAESDFAVLKKMAECLPRGVGSFHNAKLSGEALLETFSTFSTTVTSTRLSSIVGGPRVLRPIGDQSSEQNIHTYSVYQAALWKVPNEWWDNIRKGQLSKKKSDRLMDLGERSIAVGARVFGAGGERNVFQMWVGKERSKEDQLCTRRFGRTVERFVPTGEEVTIQHLLTRSELNGAPLADSHVRTRLTSAGGCPLAGKVATVKGMQANGERIVVTDPTKDGHVLSVQPINLLTTSPIVWGTEQWVAKENKKIESSNEREVEFHEKSLITQATASALGEEFNEIVQALHLPKKLPRVAFLKNCYFLSAMMFDGGKAGGQRFFFVEQMLDGNYRKWNTNFGTVSRKPTMARGDGLGALAEGVEEEDEDEDEDERGFSTAHCPTVDDVPQAFSHWTHCKKMQGKKGALLVCDLQGCYSKAENRFDWVDPVVHSDLGNKGRFGRTDRGKEGIRDFLRTHKCNALCRLLELQHNNEYDASAAKANGEDSEASSRNTSQYTVNATDHLQERKGQRNIVTRELQAAKKHGTPHKQENGKMAFDFNGVRYVEAPGKVGVTGIKDPRFHATPPPPPRSLSERQYGQPPPTVAGPFDGAPPRTARDTAAPAPAASSAAEGLLAAEVISPTASAKAKKSLRAIPSERAAADRESKQAAIRRQLEAVEKEMEKADAAEEKARQRRLRQAKQQQEDEMRVQQRAQARREFAAAQRQAQQAAGDELFQSEKRLPGLVPPGELPTAAPPPDMPKALRFSVGDRVECNVGHGYAPGKVVELWYYERGVSALVPYRVQLDSGGHVYAPQDMDTLVRRIRPGLDTAAKERVPSSAESVTLRLPPDARPGATMRFEYQGLIRNFKVPAHARGGEEIRVRIGS